MLLSNIFYTSNILLFTYMFIYNFTMIILFWTLMSNVINNSKTLYSFSNYSFDPSSLMLLSVSLFSMAGVPPFIGFFTKMFILQMLVNSNFFTFYFIFFILLFVGLYFYIQNMRFLHSSNHGFTDKPFHINERLLLSYYYFSILCVFLLVFGIVYVDDVLLIISWILI